MKSTTFLSCAGFRCTNALNIWSRSKLSMLSTGSNRAMQHSCSMPSPIVVLPGARAPTLRFLKGGIPRPSPEWDFLLTSAALLFKECTDDPYRPLFSQSPRKGWGTRHFVYSSFLHAIEECPFLCQTNALCA